MTTVGKRYDILLQDERRRKSGVPGRGLEEDADSDRGRVLFCAPFRRLQNKAQVFSLETNAAVRSRLTHSLEVSSIGRFVCQQAILAFDRDKLNELGLAGKERPLTTFVETACLLHDIGNPPFGHFGEIAISDWFHLSEIRLKPKGIAGQPLRLWDQYYADFLHFDGNPQGFRIATRLQASETSDLFGLNLTATTLAATLKYPWPSDKIDSTVLGHKPKKNGYFRTEDDVIKWIRERLGLTDYVRHPLAFLMEAADDIAYCISDIEDGIEKRLIDQREFAAFMTGRLSGSIDATAPEAPDPTNLADALSLLANPQIASGGGPIERLTPMQDFRSAAIRILAGRAGKKFVDSQDRILLGSADPLLQDDLALRLLGGLKEFATSALYCSPIVRDRELTAHAVLSGLLNAYWPMMACVLERFEKILAGEHIDEMGRRIARESSLAGRLGKKVLAVYREAVRLSNQEFSNDEGCRTVMERIHRAHLIVDFITGMTDEFALQSFHLVTGASQ